MNWELLIAIAAQTIVFLGGGYGMVLRNGWIATSLEKQLVAMEQELKKLAEVIIAQAVQANRLDNQGSQLATLQREVSDLRRGEGWIKGQRGIDREYGQ
jgi:hypothetical protein